MKSKTRNELAHLAGISTRTLREWMKPHAEVLSRLGMRPGTRTLTPAVVKYLVDTFGIDVEEEG